MVRPSLRSKTERRGLSHRGSVRGSFNRYRAQISKSCMAVGVQISESPERTLIERWNGSTWSVVPSPSPGTGDDSLEGVSCIKPDYCVTVGGQGETIGIAPIIEIWNGSAWTSVSGASTSSGSATLSGVSCTSPTSCMAVGSQKGGSLAELWNGVIWSRVASPNLGDGSDLYNVSCTVASSCAATGTTGFGVEALVEGWNGAKWSIAPVASPGFITGVSCATSEDCVGVGSNGEQPVALIASIVGIVTTFLQDGNSGTSYSTALAARGGNPPYKWLLVSGSGSLPPGLLLDQSTGAITGKPDRSGVFNFAIEVLDKRTRSSKGHPSTQNFGNRCVFDLNLYAMSFSVGGMALLRKQSALLHACVGRCARRTPHSRVRPAMPYKRPTRLPARVASNSFFRTTCRNVAPNILAYKLAYIFGSFTIRTCPIVPGERFNSPPIHA